MALKTAEKSIKKERSNREDCTYPSNDRIMTMIIQAGNFKSLIHSNCKNPRAINLSSLADFTLNSTYDPFNLLNCTNDLQSINKFVEQQKPQQMTYMYESNY